MNIGDQEFKGSYDGPKHDRQLVVQESKLWQLLDAISHNYYQVMEEFRRLHRENPQVSNLILAMERRFFEEQAQIKKELASGLDSTYSHPKPAESSLASDSLKRIEVSQIVMR